MLEAGTILQNRYLIQKQIGQGGMGAVYIAVDQRFSSTVAIKETLFLGENFEKAFEREARLLNSLRHPSLPNVRDYFSEENNQYLVMEFIAGEDLSEKLEKNGEAFNIEEVLDWSKQLLEALNFLHNQEIPVVHRDIKPQNLKLTPQGQIILLDFGLAKGIPTDAGHLTNAKSIFGYSRNYASLEQMQGTGTDPRSDLYSLAATIYHLVTGNPPVDALTRAMSVLSELADPLIPANRIHRQVSTGIANILHNAMNLNANLRPASAAEMLEMLNNSEDYDDLVNSQLPIINALPTNFLNQETKILPADHANLTSKQKSVISTGGDERETEINANRFSSKNYETNVLTENVEAKTKPDRKKSVYVIGAAVSLLLLVLGASAFYLLNVSNNEVNPEQTVKTEAKEDQKSLKNDSENINSELDKLKIAETNVSSNAPDETVKSAKTKVETSEQQKSKQSQTNPPTTQKAPKSETEFVFDDPEEGRVIMKGNTIETDKVIINDNGVIIKKPPKPPVPPESNPIRLTPEQSNKLSPKQKQRLNEIRLEMERRRKIIEQRKNSEPKTLPPPG